MRSSWWCRRGPAPRRATESRSATYNQPIKAQQQPARTRQAPILGKLPATHPSGPPYPCRGGWFSVGFLSAGREGTCRDGERADAWCTRPRVFGGTAWLQSPVALRFLSPRVGCGGQAKRTRVPRSTSCSSEQYLDQPA
jgi:hypothetical protein